MLSSSESHQQEKVIWLWLSILMIERRQILLIRGRERVNPQNTLLASEFNQQPAVCSPHCTVRWCKVVLRVLCSAQLLYSLHGKKVQSVHCCLLPNLTTSRQHCTIWLCSVKSAVWWTQRLVCRAQRVKWRAFGGGSLHCRDSAESGEGPDLWFRCTSLVPLQLIRELCTAFINVLLLWLWRDPMHLALSTKYEVVNCGSRRQVQQKEEEQG